VSDVPDPCALAIENSNPSSGEGGVSVGLREASGHIEVLARERIVPAKRHDDALMRTIEQAMTNAARSPKSLDVVVVSCGPGGFTGLRVAITAAKMIAATTGCACAPVPSAMVAVRAFQERGQSERIAVAMAGKRGTAWVAWIDTNAPVDQQLDAAKKGAVVDHAQFVDEVTNRRIDTLIADTHAPESIRDAAHDAGIQVVAPAFTSDACLSLAWSATPVDPLALAPLYPREPEAVSKWRELHG
jgi:tRNA threonylcarbamoyladenosine biosynthesis protein TsaB